MSLSNILQPNNYDIYVDNINTITINEQPYPPPSPLPTLVANKILRTNTLGTDVLWGDLPHGSPRQLLQTNAVGTNSEWTSNIDIPGTLDVTGNAIFDSNITLGNTFATLSTTATSSIIDCNGLVNTRNLNVIGNIACNGDNGNIGDVIVKTGANTQDWGQLTTTAITPGTANQVLQTDGTGTGTIWSTNLNIPFGNILAFNETLQGNLGVINGNINVSNVAGQINVTGGGSQINCNGTTNTAGLNVTTLLRLNGSSGTAGQTIISNGGSMATWGLLDENSITPGSSNQYLMTNSAGNLSQWRTISTIRAARLTAFLAAQDLNAGASGTLNYELSPQYSNNVTNLGSFAAITISSATQFTFGGTGYYDCDFNFFFDQATSTGMGNSFFVLSLVVGGVTQKVSVTNSERGLYGRIPNVLIVSGQIVTIAINRIVGTNPLNVYGSGGAAPLYASTVTWTLVNTVA